MAALEAELRLVGSSKTRRMSDAASRARPPRVSVITAAFNAERFIEVTLASARGQTFRDFEVVVVDDGSQDGTVNVVRRIIASDARVRLIEQDNRGIAATRNRGIQEARGEMIAFLDHDDLWHADKLALQVALLDAQPLTGVASCYSALIDEDRKCLGWRLGGDANGDVYAEMLVWDMVSGGSVALIRREALEAVGPFDVTLPMRSDWDMWIRIARRFPFATVPRALVGYTRSHLSVSRGYERMAEAGARVLANVTRDDPSFGGSRHRFCRARDLFAVASFCTMDGQTKLAWLYLARSLSLTPAPVLSSARRCALVAMLVLQTVLPVPAFRFVLGVANRASFKMQPGRPFLDGSPARA